MKRLVWILAAFSLAVGAVAVLAAKRAMDRATAVMTNAVP